MTTLRRALLGVLVLSWVLTAHPHVFAQETAAVARPALTPEEMETFLLKAKIVSTDEVNTGINNTRRATLSDGRITHDAHIQVVDISKTMFKPARGPAEINFKDTYRYNIAAYRLARLLGLNHVPVSVERRVDRDMASVTWWVDDVLMNEGERLKRGLPKELNASRTASQIHVMRVFDELIANQDRNVGNLVWTIDGKMWMIDHTRAFRLASELKNPRLLERCERSLLDALRALTLETIRAAVGESLSQWEAEPILKRRDAIVRLFEEKIKQRGEGPVLYAFKGP